MLDLLSAYLSEAQGLLAEIRPDTLAGATLLLFVFLAGGFILSRLLARVIQLLLDRDQRIDRMAALFLSQIAEVFL